MTELANRRPSEWQRLFAIASDLIRQVKVATGGYDFEWSFGGGTAMMIQIGHRESHDVDLFINDPQLLGFLDPSRSGLSFSVVPTAYEGDGARFQKFAFDQLGEIDFIVASALTAVPTVTQLVEGQPVQLETIPEIIAKKIVYRGTVARTRDIFDLAAASREHRSEVISALQAFPEQVAATRQRLAALNPEFVARTISQLMIKPAYESIGPDSLAIATDLLDEVLHASSRSS
ncbi:Uncharacterised protein [Starkeya nomas]|uniref:Nucleotidyl transferase AbiEii/AbiGii toxin family protein n=1 Tax=Starkeya nomas TaxID=2666134 RepID=A0A5S9NJM9_9HYPH|nr:nucleotidyl transferase AbiEii/AbiGii toxin family protein [Starkeya nomas]CAA0090025.1 Uncharacterised protein [Starkeya nomas]